MMSYFPLFGELNHMAVEPVDEDEKHKMNPDDNDGRLITLGRSILRCV